MAKPFVGPLIEVPGRYTHCVDRHAYKPPPSAGDAFLKIGPAAAGKAAFDYLLGGKLVCLADDRLDRCAFGHIVKLEPVGEKSGFDAIDNDFSFNLLLSPWAVADFRFSLGRFESIVAVAGDGMQGGLLVDPHNTVKPGTSPPSHEDIDPLPTPNEPPGAVPGEFVDLLGPNVFGYTATFTREYPPRLLPENWHQGQFEVPVLHAECEGSRIAFVAAALGPFLDILDGKLPGSPFPSGNEICHDAIGWIPFVGDFVCSIVEALVDLALLPLILAAGAAAAVAWEAAQAYDDAFITGPVSREVALNDAVIITGRWAWDAGHAGYNEFHPVKTIQKIVLPAELAAVGEGSWSAMRVPTPETVAAANDFHDRWCKFVIEAPPANWDVPGRREGGVGVPGIGDAPLSPGQVLALTPAQQATYAVAQRPEHAWRIHPLLDGCRPGDGEIGAWPAPATPHQPELR